MTDRTIPIGETTAGTTDGAISPNQPVELPVEEIRATAKGGQ